MAKGKRTTPRVASNGRILPRNVEEVRRGRYRVRVYWQGRQCVIGTFDTLTDAKAALAIARGEMARGTFRPIELVRAEWRAAVEADRAAKSVTFREWADEWLTRLEAKGRRPGTVRAYRSLMDAHLLPALGDRPLGTLTPADVERVVADLRALPAARHPGARGNGVAAPAARCLRACLNAAVAARKLDARIPVPVPPERRVRPDDDGADVATPAQVAALAAAMPDHLRIAVLLAAWCQLRQGEVLGLQRRDLEHLEDPARAVLHVRRQLNSKTSPPSLTPPKSDAGRRTVAVPAFILEDLRAHLAAHAAPGAQGPVLTPPRRPGDYVSQTTFDREWRAARTAAGLPRFRFHDLRHTGLTLYAQHGATAAELMHRGGHSSLSVALRYQHASLERDRALVDRMAATLDGAE